MANYFINKKTFYHLFIFFFAFFTQIHTKLDNIWPFFTQTHTKLDKMVRNYKRSNDSRSYKNYTEQQLADALTAISSGEMKFREASVHFKIPIGTLHNKMKGKHTNVPGHQTALAENEEKVIVDYLLAVASWGFPFSTTEVQLMVSSYLKLIGKNVACFKENTPSSEWVTSFVRRHKKLLQRQCQNIKVSRASKSRSEMKDFFNHFKTSLGLDDNGKGPMPATHIFNFDETNLSDDPGAKKCIFKRGVKYPERVMDSSKSSTSLMYCGSASGHLLPPYVVYKAEHLWSTWTEGGPPHARYNHSKSGWFDQFCFEDWFQNCFLHHTRHLSGSKVLIGDNLSSHFNASVIRLAQQHDVKFICLPSNATHLIQPLDVAFFGPLKSQWKNILGAWKRSNASMSQALSKDAFPGLLKRLNQQLQTESGKNENLVSGFRATGLYPYNPNKILNKLPSADNETEEENGQRTAAAVSDAVISILSTMRGGKNGEPPAKKRRTRINVTPGKSVSLEDLSASPSPSVTPTPTSVQRQKKVCLSPITSIQCFYKYKFYSLLPINFNSIETTVRKTVQKWEGKDDENQS